MSNKYENLCYTETVVIIRHLAEHVDRDGITAKHLIAACEHLLDCMSKFTSKRDAA